MARHFTRASNESLLYTLASEIIISNGFTLSTWINTDSPDANQKRVINITSNGGSVAIAQVQLDNGVAGTAQANFIGDDSSNCFRNTGAGEVGADAGTWQHLICSHDGTRNAPGIKFYTNGTEPTYGSSSNGTGTTKSAFVGNEIAIGYSNNTSSLYYDGSYSELAIWDRTISDGEIGALARGFSPKAFAPNFYIPLIRQGTEIAQGAPLSESVGTTTVSHNRMIYPSNPVGVTKTLIAPYRRRFIIAVPG